MYLTVAEKQALGELLFRVAPTMVEQCIPTQIQSSLLKKFGLIMFGGKVEHSEGVRQHVLVQEVALTLGYRMEILQAPHSILVGKCPFYWYRIIGPTGTELDAGMYCISAEEAVREGHESWTDYEPLVGEQQRDAVTTK